MVALAAGFFIGVAVAALVWVVLTAVFVLEDE